MKILEMLSQPQKDAVKIIQVSLDCYNSKDGIGLFTGVERYNVLANRVGLVAVQSRDMASFWAKLVSKMLWQMPPKKFDQMVFDALSVSDPAATLKALATETVSIVSIARMMHDKSKKERAAIREESAEDYSFDQNVTLDTMKDDLL